MRSKVNPNPPEFLTVLPLHIEEEEEEGLSYWIWLIAKAVMITPVVIGLMILGMLI